MKAGHECPLEKKIEKKLVLSRFPANLAHRKLRKLLLFPAIFQFFPVITPTRESFVKLAYISMQATVTAVMALALGEMFICSNIAAKSFGDGAQAIHKDKESYLGPVAGF